MQKLLGSNKIFFGEKNYKYFIGYLYNDHKNQPLHILLPKTSVYVEIYSRKTKWMHFLIKDNDLLEKYNTIWDIVRAYIKKNLIVSLCTIKNF